MYIDYQRIGARIKEIRNLNEMSQSELAEEIKMSASYISCIESGKKKPSLEALVFISNVLGSTLNEFVNGNQKHNPIEYHAEISQLMDGLNPSARRFIYLLAQAVKKYFDERNQ